MERTSRNHLILTLFALFFALVASASPLGTTYQARIIKPDGQALESANVNFKFTILNPVGTCILYSETFSAISMANSSGMISFTLGSGVKSYPASATTFAQVFNNSTPSLSCDAGGPASYSPAATDIRKIVMQFNDGNGWQTLPAMAINAVPYAIYSSDSLSLGGVSATNYIQYSTIPSCAVSEALRYNGTNFSCINVASGGGASGTITSGDVTTALGYTPANQSSVATSFTTVTNSLSTVGTSFTTVTSTINSLGSSVTALATTVSSLSASMASMTSSQWISSGTTIHYMAGNVGIGTTTPVTKLDVSGGVRIGAESTTCAPALAGTLRYNASNVEYCNGTSWQAFGVSSSGLTSLNGSTSQTQTFANATGGTAPNIATANGVHTLNIPLASTGSVTAGLLSNADYTTFTNKITSSAASIAQVLGYVPADNAASGTYTQKANNLSDLTNIATARTNLGLGTFATASSIDLGSASATGTLAIARLPSFSGDATIAAASNTIILSNSGVTAGTYTKVIVDSKGRVTSSSALASTDVTTALGYTPASATASTQWTTSGTNIYYNAGRVGIGTNTPIHKLDVSGVVLVSGDYGAGETLAVSGSGSRMFFYPRKSAFRAGFVGADEWDDNNIGDSSIALGDSPIASGYGAIALGVGSVASGTYSVAIGRYSQALGQTATAFGESNASGDLSTAFDSSSAAGLYSVAMGSSSANADRSISIGQNSNANGFGSIAVGASINAKAMNVVAVGSYNVGNGSGTAWISIDPIFEVGNSQNGSPRSNAMTILKNGNLGVGVLLPTATLHLAAGTSVTASLKLSSGTLLTAPQSGTVEYDGVNLYYTDGTSTRRTIATATSSGAYTGVTSIESASNISLAPTGSVIVSAPTASTNSQTGALVVKGGLGVAGNIYASGTIITSSNMQGASITATNGMIAPYIAGSTNSGGSIRIDSTTHASKGNILLAPNGSNVGIGVSQTPGAKFHISARDTAMVSDTYILRIDGADGIAGAEPSLGIGFCNENIAGTVGAACFKSTEAFAGAGAQYIFKGMIASDDIYMNNGSFGIGADPNYPLDVRTGNAFTARYLHASNNANDDAAIMMVRQRGTTSAGSAVLNNDSIGGMYFRAHDGTGTGTSNAHIEVVASENQSATNRGNVMTFATTQNGQATRQEIMRIHSNGFVGIGNTTPNALLQVGPSGGQNANYNIYAASYRSTAGQGQYVGNWISSDYWALGPATNVADKTLRLGIASDRTGTWSGTQDLNLLVGGNVNVSGSLNVSGTVAGSADLIPASAILLMQSCPAGWTDTGATGGGPGSATCNGVGCRLCQTASAALVPPSAKILMESCPSGWANMGKDSGPGSAGYTVNGFVVPMLTCQSPATSSNVPKGLRFMMPSCPASWSDVGAAGSGPSIVNCPGSLCRVCEVPGGTTYQTILFSGDASGTTASGPDAYVLAGKGGSTSGSGGSVSIRAGSATDGSGGAVTIVGGSASSTTNGTQGGGSISVLGGNTTTSGAGGGVYIGGGYSSYTGTNIYSDVYLSSGGGNVGVGSASATKLLHVQRDQNSDTAVLIRNVGVGTSAMSAVDVESDINGIQLVSYGSAMSGNWGGSTIPKANSAVLRTYTTLPVSNMGIGTGSAAPLHLITSDVPRLTVTSTGNVGIGTASPSVPLEVAGNVKISGQIVNPAWTAVATFSNSWTANYPVAGVAAPGYRKGADGRVYLRGCMAPGSWSTTAFTLPAGYVPSSNLTVTLTAYSSAAANAVAAYAWVYTDGTFNPWLGNSASWICMDGISYPTD